MTRSVYLIGPPGVGKSTLLDRLLSGYERAGEHKVPAPAGKTALVYEVLTRDGAPAGVALGRRRATFSGTDALGMAVHPQAVEWARREAARCGEVWGEGQRLATTRFLLTLANTTDLIVLALTADEQTLERRCANRGSSQNLQWRKAASTRAANLEFGLRASAVRVARLDATGPADRVEALARDVLEGR